MLSELLQRGLKLREAMANSARIGVGTSLAALPTDTTAAATNSDSTDFGASNNSKSKLLLLGRKSGK